MDNGIHIGYMTGTYAGFLQSCRKRQDGQTKQAGTAGTFRSAAERIAQGAAAADASRPAAADMTLEEYKQYLYYKISQIPMHPSQAMSSVSVHISDEGFQAMQKDPAYEKWVLDVLRRNFAFCDPWADVCGGSFSIHRFGATKEEYRGDGWYTGFMGGKGSLIFDDEAEESFWERRAKRFRQQIGQQQEQEEKKETMQRVYQEAALRRGDYEGMFDSPGITPMLGIASLLLAPKEAEGKSWRQAGKLLRVPIA